VTLFLILGGIAILYLIWFLFRLAAFALPVYLGVAAGLHIVETGHGFAAAISGGFGLGLLVLLLGQAFLGFSRSPLLRMIVILAFVIPAAVAGFQVMAGLGRLFLDPGTILTILSVAGGGVAASSAWRGLMLPRDLADPALPAGAATPMASPTTMD